jgi:tetratricopeptide (TPR) repeat protein
LLTRCANATISYAAYLGKTFWPFNLAIFYPYELSLPLWKVLISGIILILITLAVLYYIRKLPFLFVGWFWYLGTLIPVIGLVQVGRQAMADRYTYLPSIGIAIILAWGITLLFKREDLRRKILFPAAIAVLATSVVLSWHQCGRWKNDFTLFSYALRVTNDNYVAHNSLGLALFNEGKTKEAMEHYNKSIRIKPDYPYAYNNRGIAYVKLHRHQSAIEDFNNAIYLKQNNVGAYYNRGNTYDDLGRYNLAIEDFNKSISLKPDYAEVYYGRGNAYYELGQYQQAVEDYKEAIRIKPNYIWAYNNRGVAYFMQGNNELGCSDVQKACELGNCTGLEIAKDKGYCR